MNPSMIPALDATPIPGPAGIFYFLLVFTFILHMLFMNLSLGGTFLAAISRMLGGRREDDPRGILAGRLMGVNNYGISLTITTGVAPLLFVQVLYQQYFYTATILLGWIWFSFLVLLMVGYYSAYAFKFRGNRSTGSGGVFWLMLSALMFLLIAMIHVAVNLMHSQPGNWKEYALAPLSVVADPVFFPRFLHFLFASIGLSALVMCWWAVRKAGQGEELELNSEIARYSWKWVLWMTVFQILDGFLLLLVLPSDVLKGTMKGGAATLIPLGLAIVLALALLMLVSRVKDPTEDRGMVTTTLAIFIVGMVVMVITRQQVRDFYLAEAQSHFVMKSAPQWGPLVLFLVLFVLGLVTVAWTIRKVLSSPASGGDAA